MKKRLVWLVECVHGYESGCSFGDCVGGTYEPVEWCEEHESPRPPFPRDVWGDRSPACWAMQVSGSDEYEIEKPCRIVEEAE